MSSYMARRNVSLDRRLHYHPLLASPSTVANRISLHLLSCDLCTVRVLLFLEDLLTSRSAASVTCEKADMGMPKSSLKCTRGGQLQGRGQGERGEWRYWNKYSEQEVRNGLTRRNIEERDGDITSSICLIIDGPSVGLKYDRSQLAHSSYRTIINSA